MTVFKGTSGNDVFGGASSWDTLYGYGGNDALYGFNGNDIVYGGAGRDTLYGGNGDDALIGGPGSDIYYGGDGLDRFIFTDVQRGAGYTVETIKDYGFGEKIDVSRIDANWDRDGNQAFYFNGRADEFTGRAGEIRYEQHGSGYNQYTSVYLDVDGDRSTDMMIVIEGFKINLQAHDFVL